MAVRAPDQEDQIARAIVARSFHCAREIERAHRFTGFIQGEDPRAGGQVRDQRLGFGRLVLERAGIKLALDDRTQADGSANAVGAVHILVNKLALGPGLDAADRTNLNAHGTLSDTDGLRRSVRRDRPHLF